MPTVTMMLKDAASYSRYKEEVVGQGGEIIHDYEGLLGFTANLPEQLYQNLQRSLVPEGDILSFELDQKVTIQQQ